MTLAVALACNGKRAHILNVQGAVLLFNDFLGATMGLAGQSSLNFAAGPDTRKGCHYIFVSKTYLD